MIDVALIGPADARIIGFSWYEMIERFYAKPENEKKFQEWLQEIKKEKINEVTTIYGMFTLVEDKKRKRSNS